MEHFFIIFTFLHVCNIYFNLFLINKLIKKYKTAVPRSVLAQIREIREITNFISTGQSQQVVCPQNSRNRQNPILSKWRTVP